MKQKVVLKLGILVLGAILIQQNKVIDTKLNKFIFIY